MRRLPCLLCLLVLAAPAAAEAAPDPALRAALTRAMRSAGPASGAYVLNASERERLFEWRAGRRRVLASNTKLFTTAATLAQFGTEGTLGTEVLGTGELAEDGVWRGNLYLRGGGDPTFGSERFVRRSYGSGGHVGELADQLEQLGITRVEGRVLGDESLFDSLRGGPDSRYGVSSWVGPLSALAFNRGLAGESGGGYQSNPPAFAAGRLRDALRARGIRVTLPARAGVAPAGAATLAATRSPSMARLVQVTNKRSDNFFSEVLLKGLGASARRRGTTGSGARAAAGFARRVGARPLLVDGSGLSRANRASPRHVARLLDRLRARPEFPSFFDSLPVAGVDGTLRDRMRRGSARRRCRAKTGTLSNVSTLSGYCRSRGGDTIVFSLLMNRVNPTGARRLQDRMVQALARRG